MIEQTPTPPVCSYEGSDYQQSFWEDGGRDYEDAAEAVALQRLLPNAGSLMLELGAGAGRNTPRFHMYDKVVLLDYSRTQLEQAQQRLGSDPRYVFVAADVYRLPFVDGLFDGATMIRTLHHMVEPQLALRSVRRVLAQKALFILEFANKRNIKAILRYLAGKQSWNPFSHEPVEFVELNFDFHPKAIRQWLQDAEFKIERQLSLSYLRTEFLKKHVPLKVLVKIDSLLQWTGKVAQYSPSIFSRVRMVGYAPEVVAGSFFQCPICGQALPEIKQDLTCSTCTHVWHYQDGIYDFRASN